MPFCYDFILVVLFLRLLFLRVKQQISFLVSLIQTCTCAYYIFLFLMAWLWTHILLLSKLLSTHERALQEQWGTVPSVGSAALRAHRKTSLAGLNPLWTHRPARDTSTESLVYNREHRLTQNNSKSFRLLNDENEWKHEDSYC